MRAIDLLRRAVIATVLGCSASAPGEPDVDAPEAAGAGRFVCKPYSCETP